MFRTKFAENPGVIGLKFGLVGVQWSFEPTQIFRNESDWHCAFSCHALMLLACASRACIDYDPYGPSDARTEETVENAQAQIFKSRYWK